MKAPPQWAYDRVSQLFNEFTDGTQFSPAADYADMKGAFARYIAEHEKPPPDRDRAAIDEAIRKFHVGRGCCDGTFAEPCPYKTPQTEAREKTDEREQERRDAEAFRNASLDP